MFAPRSVISRAFDRVTVSMRAPLPIRARSASAPSSARIDCSGTSCVTKPSGGGSGKANPVRSEPVAGAFAVGSTCATVPLGTSISSCDSSSDSRMRSSSAVLSGAGVANVTRTSGMSLISTVRPSIVANVRITSANFALAKSSVLVRDTAAGAWACSAWLRSDSAAGTNRMPSAAVRRQMRGSGRTITARSRWNPAQCGTGAECASHWNLKLRRDHR